MYSIATCRNRMSFNGTMRPTFRQPARCRAAPSGDESPSPCSLQCRRVCAALSARRAERGSDLPNTLCADAVPHTRDTVRYGWQQCSSALLLVSGRAVLRQLSNHLWLLQPPQVHVAGVTFEGASRIGQTTSASRFEWWTLELRRLARRRACGHAPVTAPSAQYRADRGGGITAIGLGGMPRTAIRGIGGELVLWAGGDRSEVRRSEDLAKLGLKDDTRRRDQAKSQRVSDRTCCDHEAKRLHLTRRGPADFGCASLDATPLSGRTFCVGAIAREPMEVNEPERTV
jgi:hypothetical protein